MPPAWNCSRGPYMYRAGASGYYNNNTTYIHIYIIYNITINYILVEAWTQNY